MVKENRYVNMVAERAKDVMNAKCRYCREYLEYAVALKDFGVKAVVDTETWHIVGLTNGKVCTNRTLLTTSKKSCR